MRYLVALFITFISINGLRAQKNDYQWFFGYGNENYNPNILADTNLGGVTVDFNSQTPTVTRHIRLADMDGGNVSYCDNSGNLLFYSNLGAIFDRRDSVMQGGDSTDYGAYWNSILGWNNYKYGGLRIVQGGMALPSPADSSKAYMLYYDLLYCSLPDSLSALLNGTFYYSVIDSKGNGGLGEVVKKDVALLHDTLAFSYLSAAKHGNGRDWWVIRPYYFGNCYYTYLLTDTGIGLSSIQCIGDSAICSGCIGTSCFSPDGSKYFWVNASDGIHTFDFDRCTGNLSNPTKIPFPIPGFGDSVFIVSGIAVSPSNRFLYVIASSIVLQYDFEASDIGASVDTVAVYDGFYDLSPIAKSNFFWAQSGPDGKIYINSTNGVHYLHVINEPDKKGDSCMFTQHSFYLHTFNESSLPDFPNYRLGPLHGSACDSLSTMAQDLRDAKEKILKVFPNPASDVVTVDYGFTDWNKGGVNLEITNELGQIIFTQPLPMYSGYQKIDVSKFAAGFYEVTIQRAGAIVAMAKLVKE